MGVIFRNKSLRLHLIIVYAIIGLFLASAGSIFAQGGNPNVPPPIDPPTATPTPDTNQPGQQPNQPQQPGNQQPNQPGGQQPNQPDNSKSEPSVLNCDVCGYCNGEEPPGDWQDCRRCVYPQFGEGDINAQSNQTLIDRPETDKTKYYTSLGCISTQPGEFAQQIANVFFGIVGGLAFLTFLYGAGVLATSRGNPDRLNYGKRVIYGAIAGLMFALFAVLIIRVISQGLGLPGFG